MKFDLVEFSRKIKSDKTSGKYPNHYLTYYILLPEEIFYACQRIYTYYTYIHSVVFSFQGHYLPSSPNEREREREGERKNGRGTTAGLYTGMERCKHTGADRFMRLSKCIFMHRFTAETSSLAASHFV